MSDSRRWDTDLLLARSAILLKHLKARRADGKITAENPIPASAICRAYSQKPYDWNIRDTNIRAMVHYLRATGNDVGSNESGYWFIVDPEEYDAVIHHLTGRAREIEEIIRMARERQIVLRKRKGSLFESNPQPTKGVPTP